MIVENIIQITQQLMYFFIPEILFLIFVEKCGNGFKFRFSESSKNPNLKPFASIWTVGLVALIIYIFSPTIFETILGTTVVTWLTSLNLIKLISLTISLGGFTLAFFVNHLLGKKIDRNTYITITVAIIFFLIFLRA